MHDLHFLEVIVGQKELYSRPDVERGHFIRKSVVLLLSVMSLTFILDINSDACQPGMRGGHQMCIDAERQIIYLMGGWDGNDDLADFWMFDINQKSWRMISRDTEPDGGPCARSCHKICLDHKRKLIFMLGRYLDSEVRSTMSLKV